MEGALADQLMEAAGAEPEAPKSTPKPLALITKSPQVKVVQMSPARAQAILERCNSHNRACEEPRITQYAGDMARDGWMFTGEAIKLSRDGVLLDGQHRLWAVIQAEVTVPILVITGLDPRAQEVMDQGIPRRLHDALHLRGEPDPNNLAAALRMVSHYFRDGVPFQAGAAPGMSHAFALRFFDRGDNRERLHESLRFVSNRHDTKEPWFSRSQMAALHFLFASVDETRAIAFMSGLLTGVGGSEAALALHEQLLDEYRNASPERPRAHIKTRTVYVCKAWNFVESEYEPTPRRFTWRAADGFPGINGLD